MAWFGKTPPPPPPRSILSPKASFQGEWEGAADLEIHGHLKGTVRCRGGLTVAAGAKVDGEVRAGFLKIAGSFRGKGEAEGAEFLSGASFEGDLLCAKIRVERGARVSGDFKERRR